MDALLGLSREKDKTALQIHRNTERVTQSVQNFNPDFQVCGEREFPVHRFMLASQSPVFKAAFAHEETEEAKTGRMEIKDVDPETLEVLIKYIYTDTVEGKDWTIGLLSAADKYNLTALFKTCDVG